MSSSEQSFVDTDTVEIPLIKLIDKTPEGVEGLLVSIQADTGGDLDGVSWGELSYLLKDERYDADNRKWITTRDSVRFNGHTIRYHEGYEGGEGGGEAAYIVIGVTFPDGDNKFYMKAGFYASHYGTDWDGSFSEVTPKAVIKTEWM